MSRHLVHVLDIAPDVTGCPFCEIATGRTSTPVVEIWTDIMAIVPLKPVVAGHVIAFPRRHYPNFCSKPDIAARVMFFVSILARKDITYSNCNVITSVGPLATQTVDHFHVHLVPRREGDLLQLPWSGIRHHHPYQEEP